MASDICIEAKMQEQPTDLSFVSKIDSFAFLMDKKKFLFYSFTDVSSRTLDDDFDSFTVFTLPTHPR